MYVLKNFPLFIILLAILACNSEPTSKTRSDFEKSDNELKSDEKESLVENIPKFPTAAKEKINLSRIDSAFLEELVLNKINIIRHNQGISALAPNKTLQTAAKSQNIYQIKIGNLTHNQEYPGMRTVLDRIVSFGGNFQQVAENVQYQGFTIRNYGTLEEVLTNSYEEAAEKIVKSWVDSPGHYKNLINPQYKYTGTSVAYSPGKKALFATQVYGG